MAAKKPGRFPVWSIPRGERMEAHFMASIDQAGGKPDPENGHYATCVLARIPTEEEAYKYKTILYRSARDYKYGMRYEIKKADDGWQLHYTVINKKYVWKYMLEEYGPDKSNWPYIPGQKRD